MHLIALLCCVATCQLKEPPYLSLEFTFRRPIPNASAELEKKRVALVTALQNRQWDRAVKLSEETMNLLEPSWKGGLLPLWQAQLFLVAGDSQRALEYAKSLLRPFGKVQGRTIRTSAELYAVIKAPPLGLTLDERVMLDKSNSWAHMRWRGLRFAVDVYLARADLKSALEHQEMLLADSEAATPIEFDGGLGKVEMDSYLLPLRAAARNDISALISLTNNGYFANTDTDPMTKFVSEPGEQRRKVAAVATVVLARYYQSKGQHKKMVETFRKAIRIMEEKPVIVNREILLWFLAKEELKKAMLIS